MLHSPLDETYISVPTKKLGLSLFQVSDLVKLLLPPKPSARSLKSVCVDQPMLIPSFLSPECSSHFWSQLTGFPSVLHTHSRFPPVGHHLSPLSPDSSAFHSLFNAYSFLRPQNDFLVYKVFTNTQTSLISYIIHAYSNLSSVLLKCKL